MAIPTRCLQYLFMVFTVVYALIGLSVVVLIGINLARVFDYRSVLPRPVFQCTAVMISMGVLAILVGVLGWQAASKQHRNMLRGYAALVVLLIIVQFAMAVWALVVRVHLLDTVSSNVETAFVNRNSDDPASEKLWSSMQHKMQCCGVDGPSDYRGSSHVPWSCCISDSPHESSCQRLYQRGCIQPLSDYVRMRLAESSGIVALASLLQAGGAFLAICFGNSMANEKRRSNV